MFGRIPSFGSTHRFQIIALDFFPLHMFDVDYLSFELLCGTSEYVESALWIHTNEIEVGNERAHSKAYGVGSHDRQQLKIGATAI